MRGVMSQKNMYKISSIQTKETDSDFIKIAKLFEDVEFSITVKKSNSKQLDSNIDECIIQALSNKYKIHNSKEDLLVEAGGEKVGELDIVFQRKDISYYMEIEKSNKKTLWFDYIKILTRLGTDINGRGIVMCPTNYAHKVGVWNLYKEAVIYKNHLKRVFGGSILDRVAVIGYTQYAKIDNQWKEYDSEVVNKIKNS